MAQLTQTKSIMLNLNELVEEVYYNLELEEYENVLYLQQTAQKVWDDASPKMRSTMINTLTKILNKHGLHEMNDLNGFFSAVVGERIPQYQTVK